MSRANTRPSNTSGAAPPDPYLAGHSDVAGRDSICVLIYQQLAKGKTGVFQYTVNTSCSMRSSLAHLLEQLNLTAPDTEDGVVLVTSPPLGADPGWVEHAYISTDMEMHCLDESWTQFCRCDNVDARLQLNLLAYWHEDLQAFYQASPHDESHPLRLFVLDEERLTLAFNNEDPDLRTLSIEEYVSAHRQLARSRLGQ